MRNSIEEQAEIRSGIAIRLREERDRLGFSMVHFARLIGYTRETIRKWENGLTSINAEALALSATLGFDVQYIIANVRSGQMIAVEA